MSQKQGGQGLVTISAKYARIVTSRARNERIAKIVSGEIKHPASDFFNLVFAGVKAEAGKGNVKVVVPTPCLGVAALAKDLLPALGYECEIDGHSFIITW